MRSAFGGALRFPRPKSRPLDSEPLGFPLLSNIRIFTSFLIFAPKPLTVPSPFLSKRASTPHPEGQSTCLFGRFFHLRSATTFPTAFQSRESIPIASLCSNGAELPHRCAQRSASAASPGDHPAGGGASPKWRLSGWRAPCCRGFEVVARGRGERFPRRRGPRG